MSQYLSFLALVSVVAFAPGPDTFLTLRNTAGWGRTAGLVTAAGICVASIVQGLAAATGLGALIVHAEPVFQAVKWAGVAYLVYLGFTALRAAVRGDDPQAVHTGSTASLTPRRRMFRQGFICNITNPKVMVFNLAILPQFIRPDSGAPTVVLYALSLTAVGGIVLSGVVALASAVAGRLRQRRVRRTLDASVGAVMVGFAAGLAFEG